MITAGATAPTVGQHVVHEVGGRRDAESADRDHDEEDEDQPEDDARNAVGRGRPGQDRVDVPVGRALVQPSVDVRLLDELAHNAGDPLGDDVADEQDEQEAQQVGRKSKIPSVVFWKLSPMSTGVSFRSVPSTFVRGQRSEHLPVDDISPSNGYAEGLAVRRGCSRRVRTAQSPAARLGHAVT